MTGWRRSRAIGRACALLLMLALVAFATACGDDDASTTAGGGSTGSATGAAEKKPVNVALFLPYKNAYYNSTVEQAEATVEKMGGTIDVFDAQSQAQTQASQIQDAITSKKYNAFIVIPFDSQSIVPFVKDALDAGIAVSADTFVIGTDLASEKLQVEGLTSSAANPGELDGDSLGKGVVEACKDRDPCNVIFLAGFFSGTYDVGVKKGAEAVIKQTPSIKVVAQAEGKYLADSAYDAMKDVLQAHRDVDVVYSTADTMIIGAERAVRDAGLEPGSEGVRLVGNGASEIAAEGLEKGTWFSSLVWLPKTSIDFNLERLQQAVNGEEVKEPRAVYTTRDLTPIGLFLTQDNLTDFEPQYQGS